MKQNKIRWITQTAVLLALLVILQTVTKPAGQLVTGSCVNCILAICAICAGMSSGLTVALVSPFMAFLLGIGPAFFPLTPIIAAGNCVYVLLICLLTGKKDPTVVKTAAAVVPAAVAKFGVLYLLVVQGVCRLAPLKPPQIATFSAMFSFPQLTTALIGGAVACLCAPVIRKAIHK